MTQFKIGQNIRQQFTRSHGDIVFVIVKVEPIAADSIGAKCFEGRLQRIHAVPVEKCMIDDDGTPSEVTGITTYNDVSYLA